MKIPRGDHQTTESVAQIGQSASQHMHQGARALDGTGHAEQARMQQRRPLCLGGAGPDDDIGGAGLVFQRDKDDAAGGARPLPAGDQPGDAADSAGARCAIHDSTSDPYECPTKQARS